MKETPPFLRLLPNVIDYRCRTIIWQRLNKFSPSPFNGLCGCFCFHSVVGGAGIEPAKSWSRTRWPTLSLTSEKCTAPLFSWRPSEFRIAPNAIHWLGRPDSDRHKLHQKQLSCQLDDTPMKLASTRVESQRAPAHTAGVEPASPMFGWIVNPQAFDAVIYIYTGWGTRTRT